MESFRSLIKGKFGKVLLAIFLVPFALVGVEGIYSNMSSSSQMVVAKVAGQKIDDAQLSETIKDEKSKLLERVGNDESRIDNTILKQKVLDNLVSKTALLAQAKDIHVGLNDKQIVELIQSQQVFQTNGKFDNELFKRFLIEKRVDRNQFLNSIREDLMLKQMVGGFSQSSFVTGKELDSVIIAQDDKRHAFQTVLPLARYASAAAVSAADINNYYTQHKATLKTLETADIEYITLDSNQFLDKATVTDADIAARYQEVLKAKNADVQLHTQLILIPIDATNTEAAAKAQAEALAKRLQAGEDFATLAKQYSKDPVSASNGGDLGLQPESYFDFDPAFKVALQTLQVGQVSAPVKSEQGYHLIKLLEKKSAAVASLESMKTQLTNEVRLSKADALYQDAITSINEAAVDADKLVDVAKEHNLSITRLAGFSKRTATGELANKDFIASTFSQESLEDRKIASGVAVTPTHTVWAQVTAYHPVKEKTLTEATPEIQVTLQQTQAMKAAQAYAAKIVAAINAGASTAQAAQQFGISFNDLGEIKRQNGLSARLTSTIFALPTPAAGRSTAAVVKSGDQPSDVIVVAVNGVVVGQPNSLSASDRKGLAGMYSDSLYQQEFSDYVQYLKSHFKAKITDVKK